MADNETYWLSRHEKLRGQTAAVGKIGVDEAENLHLYANKKRRLVNIFRALDSENLSGKSVLEGGCGIGLLCELFYVLGANDIAGVDISPIATTEASQRCPSGRFQAASLLDFRFEQKFDFVLCIDVLYHIVDDDNWRRVLGNLVAHAKPDGRVILLDRLRDEPVNAAAHVRFRTKAMYTQAMRSLGMEECTPPGHVPFFIYKRA
jgi:2-polyprenyl-3-methyl-5-hydroxy-6-metoxy-1,4-benzoquinol methylase